MVQLTVHVVIFSLIGFINKNCKIYKITVTAEFTIIISKTLGHEKLFNVMEVMEFQKIKRV